MMPLSMANTGATWKVDAIKGKEDTRHHLENLGFVPGCTVSVVNLLGGNMIVKVKDTRVALNQSLAAKIWGEEVEA